MSSILDGIANAIGGGNAGAVIQRADSMMPGPYNQYPLMGAGQVVPYPVPTGEYHRFEVKKISNGYVLSIGLKEVYCADIAAVGSRVTVALAETELTK